MTRCTCLRRPDLEREVPDPFCPAAAVHARTERRRRDT